MGVLVVTSPAHISCVVGAAAATLWDTTSLVMPSAVQQQNKPITYHN